MEDDIKRALKRDGIELALKTAFISSALATIHEEGDMKNFLEFARARAKADGMDSKEVMEFFDMLEELEDEDSDSLDWIEIADVIQKETKCEVSCYKGDNTLIISNERISDNECLEYLETKKSRIHIGRINEVLKPLGVELEFVEALNLPFEVDGFSNFVRFGVNKL